MVVNKVVYSYISQYYGTYSLSDLRKRVKEGGYSRQEFDLALKEFLSSKKGKKKVKQEEKRTKDEGVVSSRPLVTKDVSSSKPSLILFLTFIFSLILSFIFLVSLSLSFFPSFFMSYYLSFSISLIICSFICLVFSYIGFFILGRRTSLHLLSFSSLFSLILLVLFLAFVGSTLIYLGYYTYSFFSTNSLDSQIALQGPTAIKSALNDLAYSFVLLLPSLLKTLLLFSFIVLIFFFVFSFILCVSLFFLYSQSKLSLYVSLLKIFFVLSLVLLSVGFLALFFIYFYNPGLVIDLMFELEDPTNISLTVSTLFSQGLFSLSQLVLFTRIMLFVGFISFLLDALFFFLHRKSCWVKV
jgi:hypothetical protein